MSALTSAVTTDVPAYLGRSTLNLASNHAKAGPRAEPGLVVLVRDEAVDRHRAVMTTLPTWLSSAWGDAKSAGRELSS